MKYKIVIELDENRETCMNCPLIDADDYCEMQKPNYADDWIEQLSNCPLSKIESFKVVDNQRRFPQVGLVHEYRCGNCNFELNITCPKSEMQFCPKCGEYIDWDVPKKSESRGGS